TTGDEGSSGLFILSTTAYDGGSVTLLANDGMNIAGTFELNATLSGDAGSCLVRGNFDVPAAIPEAACACFCPSAESNSDCSSGGAATDPFLLVILAILGLRVRQRRS